ncbi:hypothetical protein C8R44DRAFT_832592 [Mycena epipterygia]|nr:hypothetical protein C8R44DRAFT_832592 [Mycena epipterygia]
MRRDVQEILRATLHHKQVMIFSATLAKEIPGMCKKFMANPHEILLMHGQVAIFVKSVAWANELDKLLVLCNFPSISIHSGLVQEERRSLRFGTMGIAQVMATIQSRFMVAVPKLPDHIDPARYNEKTMLDKLCQDLKKGKL